MWTIDGFTFTLDCRQKKGVFRIMGTTPSVFAQVIIAIIPIVGIVMGCAVIFFYLLWHHQRAVLLIKSEHYQRPSFDLPSFCLLSGILLSSLGISLTLVLVLLEGFDFGLLGGVIPLAVGIGLLVFYGVTRDHRPS